MTPQAIDADTREANAAPTKGLLVDVLTKDIDLVAAILDLVDNSVDAARRLRKDEDLDGLRVSVSITKTSFKIEDNCGGIALEDAATRAFAFGPDDDDPPDPYSTGQFGVGMKRALFKLGKAFSVRAKSEYDSFRLDVNVESWLRSAPWLFELTDVKKRTEARPEASRGTTIEAKPLHAAIAKELARKAFLNDLKAQIASRHQISLARGLRIDVGGENLQAPTPKVVVTDEIRPYIGRQSINGASEHVEVRIVCGVVKGKPADAGWSVFLNDRAVLLADKTDTTGWGETEDARIPRFHNQYSRFRGFAFLECEDTTRLPWNTTKTGLDRDDAIYQSVRGLMLDAADPVVDFLDVVKKENSEDGRLKDAIEQGATKSVFELAEQPAEDWVAPEGEPEAESDEPTTRIYTDQDPDLVEEVKEVLGAKSNREVGDALFNYFVEREL